MPYYATIAEDLARAREILLAGQPRLDALQAEVPDIQRAHLLTLCGGILGADLYASWRLLASLADQVENYLLLLSLLGVDVDGPDPYKAAVRRLALLARQDAPGK